MKNKKVKITEKNIYSLNGLINKFFKSIEKKHQYIVDIDSYKWKDDGYHTTSFHGESEMLKLDSGEIVIHIKFPVNSILHMGDFIIIDGNKFMYKYQNMPWGKIYRRKLPEYEIKK